MSNRPVVFSILCIWLIGISASSLAGEDVSISQRLPAKLDEAIAVALQNRMELALASQQRVSAAHRTEVAMGNFLPQLFLSGTSKYRHLYDEFTGTEAVVPFGGQVYHVKVEYDTPPYTSNASLDLTYNLFSGGKDTAHLEELSAEHPGL